MMKKPAAILSLLCGIGVFGNAYAQDKDFAIQSVHINPVTQPKSITDVFKDCASDQLCSQLLTAAASYFGVPSTAMSAALAVISVNHSSGSEEYRYSIAFPPGYTFCHATVNVISAAPASGPRDPAFGATANKTEIGIYAWVGQQGLGEGRSWIDTNITVLSVKNDLFDKYLANNTCVTPGQIIACRGGGSHGQPKCTTTTR